MKGKRMGKRKILTTEQAVALVTSGKKSDMKKFIKAFVREIREDIVADSDDGYESVEDLMDDYGEECTEFGCLDSHNDETYFGLRVHVVDTTSRHDGERIEDSYAIEKDGVPIAYFRTSGYYTSYDGNEWDDVDKVDLVRPFKVEVTKFMTAGERKSSREKFL